jgi:outer membrane protein
MQKIFKNPLIIIIVSLLINIVFVVIYVHCSHKKIAVVDAIQLFNSFKMKLEMEEKASASLKYLNHVTDSLKQDLIVKSKVKDYPKADLEKIYNALSYSENIWEQEYQRTNKDINEQVWKRLNVMIDDYGKQEGLRLIIGANGMGSVLYNDEYYDKTKEMINYANKKYEGSR